MKLGMSSYTLTWAVGVPGYESPAAPLDSIDLLHLAANHGIEVLQIADNIPLHLLSQQELTRIKQTADSLHIELEIGTRGSEPEHLLEYLRIARLLGCKLVRTLITESELERPRQQLHSVLPDFQSAAVVIAVENHGLHTTRQLAALFEHFNSPWLGCCLDTVNSFGALDSPDQVVRDLAPYLVNLHLKDFDITRVDHQMGFVVLGTAAGHGKLNIREICDQVRAQGKHPNVILELWTPYKGSVEATISLEQTWFEQSLAYLRDHPL